MAKQVPVSLGKRIVHAGGYGGTETTTVPDAPSANGYVIFAVDSGGGKTILKVRFASGGEQTLATEP